MVYVCLILVVLLLIFIPADPQAHNIKFEHISIEDGLSECTVHCLLQDTRGFIWCGTQDGLNKYDGYQFTIFKNDPTNPNSISDNIIIALYEDRSENLWIGTNHAVLNKYDREKEQFVGEFFLLENV